MTGVPHGPGGVVVRACAYDARHPLGQTVAVRTAHGALVNDVGPYLTGAPALFEFDQDVGQNLLRLYGVADFGTATDRIRAVHDVVVRLGEHARLVVVVAGVIDGYAEARAEVDAR